MNQDISLKGWLDELAARQPTPGGGGAAALAAAVAAGLVGMVSIYTTGEKWADRAERMQAISDEAAGLRTQALDLMEADAAAFAKVGAAYGLARDSDEAKAARQTAIQAALVAAAEPPTAVAQLAAKIVVLAEELAPAGNSNVISDVAVAASQARAALEGAIVNIEINAKLITDQTVKDQLAETVRAAEQAILQADAVTAAVRKGITS